MKIILLRDLAQVGRRGQIIEVSEAYARNYLLPNRIAIIATAAAQNKLIAQLAAGQAAQERQAADFQSTRQRLEHLTLRIRGKANNQGGLFAAIKIAQIKDELKTQYQIKLPDLKIEPDTFKKVGNYSANLKWPDGKSGSINIIIESA